MESNLITNDTLAVLPELEEQKRPCFYSGISQTFQFHFFYYSNIFLTPVTIVLGLWCSLSNGLVLISIFRSGLRIRPGFLLLCSLTLTDVVWGGLIAPMYIRIKVIELIDGKACALYGNGTLSPFVSVAFFVCLFSTLGNLGVISADRYLAVAKPLFYKATITRQHAIIASSGVWLTSMTMAILRKSNLFPRKEFKIFEGSVVMFFACLIIIIQILTLLTLRKNNNAVAQAMEESARVNPATAHDAVERQLTATTRHVVCLLGLLFVPVSFLRALSEIIGLNVKVVLEPFFFPIITLCSGINPVLYYRGNDQIKNGITKLVKCQ